MTKLESPPCGPFAPNPLDKLLALPVVSPDEQRRWHIGTQLHTAGHV